MRPLDHATPGRNGFDAGWFKFVSNIWWWLSRRHIAAPAPDSSRHGVWHSTHRFTPYLFFIFFNSCWFALKPADLARFRWKREPNGRIGPIPAEMAAETGRYGHQNRPKWAAGRHSSASCGLVRGKKKKREKEEEDEKAQKKWMEEE